MDQSPATPPSLRRVALPSEHGGWSLTLEPVVLGPNRGEPQEAVTPIGREIDKLAERLHRVEMQEILVARHELGNGVDLRNDSRFLLFPQEIFISE